MTDILTEARERIAALQQQIAILQQFVDSAEKATVLLHGEAAIKSSMTGDLSVDDSSTATPSRDVSLPVQSAESPVKRTRVSDNPKPAVLIPAAIEILRQHGQPMSRRQLHEALSGRGLVVKGADPIKALGTILWRAQDQIVQIEGRGYWPKEDVYEPARYWGNAHGL
ncbi:hypothetical protein MU852_03015 [Brevundimonas albigilva]|uniref:hypothetical protein n=1 Tax=Brevundimonas albigilva TaxID=1312364 RepID=UPI00201B7B77|nr:hypothetical protein [Brevundimonas albigilva]UQV18868.1 hypothetical protein MU852_03015 [Brevundimonas albigilva]